MCCSSPPHKPCKPFHGFSDERIKLHFPSTHVTPYFEIHTQKLADSGVLESCMIHECLDFILTLLKKAAEVGIMMSDLASSLCHIFTPLSVYIVDVQEASLLAAVAGKTLHLTMATYK